MASDEVVVIEKWKTILEGAGMGTVSMRETAFTIHTLRTMFPPSADSDLSLRALTPGLETAGLTPQAMPAGWISLRVLALAARVLKLRQLAEQYRRQQAEEKFKTAELQRNSDYNILIAIVKLVNEQRAIFNKIMM